MHGELSWKLDPIKMADNLIWGYGGDVSSEMYGKMWWTVFKIDVFICVPFGRT